MHKAWDKTELENLIFYRAALEEATIVCCRGKLKAANSSPSALLHALLVIYNQFFEKENRLFVKQETRWQNQENSILARVYRQEQRRYPLQKSFYLTWAGKD